jgi:cytochrome P450
MPKDIREPATEMSAPPSAEWESADPYPLLAAARRRGAVSTRSPFGDASRDDGAIHVLGYDEALAVLRDAETYPSGHLGDAIGPMFKNTIMAMDEPEHSLHRALVSPVFRPKLLAHWQESFIRGVIDDLIDTIVADGRADLVESLTFAFPVRVIADILGLPKEDVARFKEWADDLVNIFYALDRGLVALSEFEAYFSPLVAERRARPQDDLISFLVTSEVDGQRLSDDAVLSFIRLLLPAGIEST